MVGGTEEGQKDGQGVDEEFPRQRRQGSTLHTDVALCAKTQRMERDVACSRRAARYRPGRGWMVRLRECGEMRP